MQLSIARVNGRAWAFGVAWKKACAWKRSGANSENTPTRPHSIARALAG